MRVSTDEQAALEFNSLQAQEQICKTYVSMRDSDPAAPERWTHADTYSDPGYSGGTLERPALRRLLDDVVSGQVDTILVYKIDRLSRSIHQFYRIWEVMERHRVDLVSATQDLNTSTSQGKLMLNMLLSFGQFEREQISERTRDKIAAARKRGLMTGGTPILGYDTVAGRLVVNQEEASVVRVIYETYLREQSLTATVREIEREGIRSKTWTTKAGVARGGGAFDKVVLYNLLRRPQYAGMVPHRGTLFPAQHESIISEEDWQRAQTLLTRNGSAGYQGDRENSEALLKGLLYCAQCGCKMTPTYTTRGNRRHRYYVCQTRLKKGAHACPAGRVAAHGIEKQVVERIRPIGRDPDLIAEAVKQAAMHRKQLIDQHEAEGRSLRRELGVKRTRLRRLKVTATSEDQGIRDRIAALERRLLELPVEIAAAKRATVGEDEVRSALEGLVVWEVLWSTERAQILRQLVEAISCEGHEGQLDIQFRTPGPLGFEGVHSGTIGIIARTATRTVQVKGDPGEGPGPRNGLKGISPSAEK